MSKRPLRQLSKAIRTGPSALPATYEAYTLTLGYTDTSLSGIYKVTSGPFETNAQLFAMISFKIP